MTSDAAALAREALAVEQKARQALADGDHAMPSHAKLLSALPVRTLAGALQDWFVPVVVGDRLVAFLRFTPQRVLMSTSSFMRQPGCIDECPLAADWLDKGRVRSRAQTLAEPGEDLGEPMLSFDGTPAHLAWALPLRRPNAEPRWVFVAGSATWLASPG